MNEPSDTEKDAEVFSEHVNFDSERFLLNLASVFIILVFTFILGQSQTHGDVKNVGIENNVLGAITQNENVGLPMRLIIPAININATVEDVGVSSKGMMDTPKKTSNVAWFDLGPRPGQSGSAVIAGHLVGIYGEPAIFTNLYKLKKGDKVLTEDNKGMVTTFIVQGNRVYDPGYADDIFGQGDGVHLNLVTCDGVWNETKKSYSKRLVVFTDIVK